MAERIKVPGNHQFGRGWMLGKFAGQDAFSDGCALFVGKPPRGRTCKLEAAVLDGMLIRAVLKKMKPTEVVKKEKHGGFAVVILKGGTAIQQKYYDFLLKRFPKAKLYLGKKIGDKEGRYVFGVDGSELVALITPICLGIEL